MDLPEAWRTLTRRVRILGHKTALYDQHLAAGAKIVDFGGWDMPIHYGSQMEEHRIVRTGQGIFDVSHMTVVDISGPEATAFLRYLLANDVAKLSDSQALYSGMLNEAGGVIDDLIVYRRQDEYRLVVNCATREKDLAWMSQQIAQFDASMTEQDTLAIVAVQGPEAVKTVADILGDNGRLVENLKPFYSCEAGDIMVGRTGYTGEDGVEIILPSEAVVSLWDALVSAGVKPCGLGARDTLRLEAGMNLYGSDMDETTTPLESNMGWTVAWNEDRDFIGKAALETHRSQGVANKLVGLVLNEKGILRAHQVVHTSEGQTGEITSGSFSPTLGLSVALARIPKTESETCQVEMRGKQLTAQIVKPPFVRNGKKVFE